MVPAVSLKHISVVMETHRKVNALKRIQNPAEVLVVCAVFLGPWWANYLR